MLKIINSYINTFWILTLDMAPWLLLGFFIAGLLKVFYPEHLILKHFGGNNFKSYFNAALVGIPMPLCSCGVIPTAITFYKNGASKSATNSFLISTPQTGIDSILATYSMLGAPFAIIKPVIAFLIGIFGGKITSLFEKETNKKDNFINYLQYKTNKNGYTPIYIKIIEVFRYGFIELMASIAKWLLIGLAIAALISVLVPENFFQNYINNFWLQMLIILVVSIPLYVCATGSIPIAKMLILKGISPAIALLFLIAGPATNIVTITILGKTMGKKSLFAYLFSIIFGSLFFTILMYYFIPINFFLNNIGDISCCTTKFLPYVISVFSGVILLVLMSYTIIKSLKFNKFNNIKTPNLTIKVEGISCNHCVGIIECELLKLENINSVNTDLNSGLVYINGVVNKQIVIKVIEDLGYKVISCI